MAKRTYFEELEGFQRGINELHRTTKRVHGTVPKDQRSIDEYAARVERQQAKLARRAARANKG